MLLYMGKASKTGVGMGRCVICGYRGWIGWFGVEDHVEPIPVCGDCQKRPVQFRCVHWRNQRGDTLAEWHWFAVAVASGPPAWALN